MESVLLDILVSCVIGYAIGRLIVWVLIKRLELQLNQELELLVDKIVDELLVPVTVEVEGNLYYCYNATSNEFVCQGVDVKEISKNFNARFPSKKLALLNGDQEAIATLKKQLEELKNEDINSVGHSS